MSKKIKYDLNIDSNIHLRSDEKWLKTIKYNREYAKLEFENGNLVTHSRSWWIINCDLQPISLNYFYGFKTNNQKDTFPTYKVYAYQHVEPVEKEERTLTAKQRFSIIEREKIINKEYEINKKINQLSDLIKLNTSSCKKMKNDYIFLSSLNDRIQEKNYHVLCIKKKTNNVFNIGIFSANDNNFILKEDVYCCKFSSKNNFLIGEENPITLFELMEKIKFLKFENIAVFSKCNWDFLRIELKNQLKKNKGKDNIYTNSEEYYNSILKNLEEKIIFDFTKIITETFPYLEQDLYKTFFKQMTTIVSKYLGFKQKYINDMFLSVDNFPNAFSNIIKAIPIHYQDIKDQYIKIEKEQPKLSEKYNKLQDQKKDIMNKRSEHSEVIRSIEY